MCPKPADRWTDPSADFRYLLFERVDPAKNEDRFYSLAWHPTLLDAGVVVRIYGRKGRSQTTQITPFPSLADAWPTIRRHIRTRLPDRGAGPRKFPTSGTIRGLKWTLRQPFTRSKGLTTTLAMSWAGAFCTRRPPPSLPLPG